MAIDITSLYPGRVNPADSNYPYGSIKNKSPGADDGTPLDADWGNDIWGFLQSLLNAASITPNGVVERVGSSQYLNALRAMGLRSANNSQAGVVELATAGETQDGTDSSRAVTPASLTSRTATTARSGLIELATDAEAQALTSNSVAITPSTLGASLKGSNQSLAANGYQRLMGGLIFQWFSVSHGNLGNEAEVSFVFPIAFNQVFRAFLSDTNGTGHSGENHEGAQIIATTNAGGTVRSSWSSREAGAFTIFAIGR